LAFDEAKIEVASEAPPTVEEPAEKKPTPESSSTRQEETIEEK
jgi:hypothetical protein